VLSVALNDVKMNEPQTNHIVFIGSQSINFNTLRYNYPTDSLPPIYSYFMNDYFNQNFYNEFKKICREGISSETIEKTKIP
jgi:hypothetical protein